MVGSLNILRGAVFAALMIPTVVVATPLTGEAPELGALLGQNDDSLLFDGAGGGGAARPTGGDGVATSSFGLRPATDPLSLTLTSTDAGTTPLPQAPLPGALVMLLGGLGAFWLISGRRKPS